MLSGVQIAPFKEHPIVDYSTAEAGPFDITAYAPGLSPGFIVSGRFSMQQYCTCLLHKLFQLNKSEIKSFIQYQCEQLNEPFVWLNKLEKLIDLNGDLFTTREQQSRIEKALRIIELLRQEIQNNKFNNTTRFNFDRVKQRAKNYPTVEEQLLFLEEAKTEYLQNKPAVIQPGEVPFDEKVQLEIELLKKQSKLRRKQSSAVQEGKSPFSPIKKSPVVKDKFQINTNLNQFMDIFYQLMHEKKVNNKPYLEASPNELCNMISIYFKDKDGNDISLDTIKTILKPSRVEKRPKGSARFDIKER